MNERTQKINALLGGVIDNTIWSLLVLSNGAVSVVLLAAGIAIALLAVKYIVVKKNGVMLEPCKYKFLFGLVITLIAIAISAFYGRYDVSAALLAIFIINSSFTLVKFTA
jgi:hypothetical protein